MFARANLFFHPDNEIVVRPTFPGVSTKSLVVTDEEYSAIEAWYFGDTEANIQDLLPHWTPSQREVLMTGMNDDEWDNLLGPEE